MRHTLANIDERGRTADCAVCGRTRIRSKGKGGGAKWRCNLKDRRRAGNSNSAYRFNVQDKCERYGFVPEHICQLDVHHLDHDHHNNDRANLQTLCACCHRLDKAGLL